MNRILLCFVLSLLSGLSFTQEAAPKAKARKQAPAMTDAPVKHEDRVYKKTPQGELTLHFSFPADWKADDKRPVILFFFGGGWTNGSYIQFVSQSDYFASRGMVAASGDYRIKSIHKTEPDKCVEDAKSAVRWLRQHATELGIDPDKVVASGGSAGGHIAACTALVTAYDAETDPKGISAVPNAMVLFNPALNIEELKVKKDPNAADMAMFKAITPNSFIKAGTPPAIMFFGTDDKLKAGADQYLSKAKPLGVRAELWTADGQAHGFFNHAPYAQLTAKKADEFLASLGYVKGEPTVKVPDSAPALKEEK
jgi:acetyl esterase